MKHYIQVALLLFVPLASALAQPADFPLKPIYPDAAPVCSPEELKKVVIPNTTIESVTIDERDGAVRVTAIVTHPPASDRVKVWVALPVKNWNGRFRGNGGGGFLTGSAETLRGAVAQGFAAAATDGGHDGGSGSFALHASGRLNWQEIRDFAYLGIHEMTVVGKALTQAFYGKAPRYSYFVGGSTGGRQGLMEAQRYPADYDGIFSGCPAINWGKMVPAGLWPQAVMNEAKHYVSKAKLDAATDAVIAAFDAADGVPDGVIDDPDKCTWDPKALVGTTVGDETFTEADADVLRDIWAGARGRDGTFLWHGLSHGANLVALAGTGGTPLTGKPFGIGLDWFKYFLAQSPNYDGSTLNRNEFELLFKQSAEEFGPVFSADNPDLSAFRDHGGKVIILHGLTDQLIPHEGSVDYYERVQKQVGGAAKAAEFARLFLVPGVDHGFRGPGATPNMNRLLVSLVAWTEEGKAPDRLLGEARDAGGKVIRTRPIFPYPQTARYSGSGDPNDAQNFVSQTSGN
jgi:Tannase and feruloyl esterase